MNNVCLGQSPTVFGMSNLGMLGSESGVRLGLNN